jgi:iron complex outermembrane receptor protein
MRGWTCAAVIDLAVGGACPLQARALSEADGATGFDGVEDALIIVTARHREEDLQRVPVAISVLTREQLESGYTVNTQGIASQAPSLTYSSANPRNTAFTIRGLGSSVVAVSQANDGLEPGVGFYVDQVYHARAATAAFDFTDVERIEVLRGPQGTLFGKNTTAGAINIITRLPTFDREASFELSYGQRDFLQAKGSASGPLSGNIAYRLSALSTRRAGVLRNVVTGQDHNRIGNQAVRGQLLLELGGSSKLRLSADFANFESECCTQVPLRVGTSLRPAARQFPALAAGVGYALPSFNPYDRLTDIDAPLRVNTSEGGVSAIFDWQAADHTLTSVSAWRFWNWDAANDRDYTGLAIQLVQHIPSRQDQVSQELRLTSPAERPVTSVAGLYYFRQTITGRPISIYGPRAAYWLIGPTTGASNTPVPPSLLDGYQSDGRTPRTMPSTTPNFRSCVPKPTPRETRTGACRAVQISLGRRVTV